MDTSKKIEGTPAKAVCTIEGCKRPYRAKGLCISHYKMWRHNDLEGHKGRYKICTKEGCRKPRFFGSLCLEHSGKAPAAEAAPAAG